MTTAGNDQLPKYPYTQRLTQHVGSYRYVHLHLGPDEALTMPSYAGRTEMFADGLKLGNASLRIRNLQLSDDGRYRCVIPQLALDTTIKLELFGKF